MLDFIPSSIARVVPTRTRPLISLSPVAELSVWWGRLLSPFFFFYTHTLSPSIVHLRPQPDLKCSVSLVSFPSVDLSLPAAGFVGWTIQCPALFFTFSRHSGWPAPDQSTQTLRCEMRVTPQPPLFFFFSIQFRLDKSRS